MLLLGADVTKLPVRVCFCFLCWIVYLRRHELPPINESRRIMLEVTQKRILILIHSISIVQLLWDSWQEEACRAPCLQPVLLDLQSTSKRQPLIIGLLRCPFETDWEKLKMNNKPKLVSVATNKKHPLVCEEYSQWVLHGTGYLK